MKIIFFLVHPGHFHLFKNVIKGLKTRGHKVTILIKTKDVLEQLLQNEDWSYINTLNKYQIVKGKYTRVLSKIQGLLQRQYHLIKIIIKKRPDLLIGTEWAIVHVGKLFAIPSIIVNEDDTEATPENKLFYPFASHLLLPACCDIGKWDNKKITYEGYHELAYLHPSHFTPNNEVIKKFNLVGKPYAILRLVSLTASHDIGKSGITDEIAKRIIPALEKKMKVYITTEGNLSNDLMQYKIMINPSDIHHALYFADIFIGDSQTMTAEAAIVGTPSIRFNDFVGKLGYLEELEHKYGLTYGIRTSESEKLCQIIEELSNMPNLKEEWQKRRQKMLSEKIDVAAFMVWFIENYPESVAIMKANPDYQYNFKSSDYPRWIGHAFNRAGAD